MIEKLFSKKSVRTLFLAFMVLLAAVSLVQGIRNAYTDSQDFQWDAMKVFSLKINPYDESLNPSGVLESLNYDEYYLQMEANQFPSLLMILLPFAVFEPLTARYVWIVCNLIFTGLILYLLKKTFLKEMDVYLYSLLSLFMIAGTPYRNQLGVGQHTLFAFCFFLIAVYFSQFSKKENRVIVTLALFVCYFKYTLTLPLVLYFVYKKKYREIIISALMHVLLTVAAAVWLDDSVINMIIKPLKVSSALSAEGGLDISALMGGSSAALVIGALVMAAFFVIALKLPEGFDKTFISVLILWSVIITYHRTYDFFVIITAAALFYEISSEACPRIKGLIAYYLVTAFSVFFILRVFHESTMSKIAVGALYYLLTGLFTYVLVSRGFLKPGKPGSTGD